MYLYILKFVQIDTNLNKCGTFIFETGEYRIRGWMILANEEGHISHPWGTAAGA
jgi:hypothetical protein